MVSDDDLEVELRFVRGHAAGSLAGVFGPELGGVESQQRGCDRSFSAQGAPCCCNSPIHG